ncbi:exported protein of unknown function (plasmid) [Cupriavidus taiwanensis]|uniref:Uncharacterized protein n=1 Tax=Cupriavidus taiwanensis TaxID=164546 RepID=A0A375IU87_9BURK|nr:hypothetical protein [Cupriavidus taiwanensis]SPK77189.1 exported protein of unknown function [Cupriavidus taiwanensis]
MTRLFLRTTVAALLPLTAMSPHAAELSTQVGAKSVIRPIADKDCKDFGEHLFKELTNCAMTDDPTSLDLKKKDYRLGSRVGISASCSKGKLKSWKLQPVEFDFGTEGPLIASGELHKALEAKPSLSGSTEISSVSFSYTVKGRPAPAAEALFLAAKPGQPRKCRDIWHTVSGTLSCNGEQPIVDVKLNGSQFPTHRAWVGAAMKAEVRQGPVGALWQCSTSEPSLIR